MIKQIQKDKGSNLKFLLSKFFPPKQNVLNGISEGKKKQKVSAKEDSPADPLQSDRTTEVISKEIKGSDNTFCSKGLESHQIIINSPVK